MTTTFCLYFFLISLNILPCFNSILCEFGNYTRNIGIPREADGIYDLKNCSACFAFECNIIDPDGNSTKEVKLFGAGCNEELEIGCQELFVKNSAKIIKNEAFSYSGKEGSVLSCLNDNCATNNFL
uniref:Sodefrin-like factor n=1 Tax=Panagrolaimus davidi TaxID=227884 RepID=A0A914PT63_9BILA